MVSWDFHVQIGPRVAKVFCDQHCALLTNKKSSLFVQKVSILISVYGPTRSTGTYAESVAAHVVRADRQVANLEALDAVNIETLIHDTTVRCDGVAFPWCHATCSKTVPSSLNVTRDCRKLSASARKTSIWLRLTPLLNMLDVILTVLQGSPSFVLVGVENRRPGLLSGLQWSGPRP